MTYEVIILGHLHMPLYFIGTFTEYPCLKADRILQQASQAVCTTIIHSTGCFLSTIDLGFRANE